MKPKYIIVVVITTILLGLTFFLLKPKPQPHPQQNTSIHTETRKTFELVIQNKKIVSGQSTITVKEGDKVTLKITSDEAEEFHIHGYDQSVELLKNKMVELSFTANITGRFELELEESKTELGALEVLPK